MPKRRRRKIAIYLWEGQGKIEGAKSKKMSAKGIRPAKKILSRPIESDKERMKFL